MFLHVGYIGVNVSLLFSSEVSFGLMREWLYCILSLILSMNAQYIATEKLHITVQSLKKICGITNPYICTAFSFSVFRNKSLLLSIKVVLNLFSEVTARSLKDTFVNQ